MLQTVWRSMHYRINNILLDEARNVIWAATDFGLARLDLSGNRTGGGGAYFEGATEDVVFSTFTRTVREDDQYCSQVCGLRAPAGPTTLFMNWMSHAGGAVAVLNITALNDPVMPMKITTIDPWTRDYNDVTAEGVAVDSVGNVYVGANSFVDKWTLTDGVTYEEQRVVAGNAFSTFTGLPGQPLSVSFNGIPGPATSANLNSVRDLVISPVDDNLLFIADPGNSAIFMVDLGANTISVAVGTPPTGGPYVPGVGGKTSAVGISMQPGLSHSRTRLGFCLPPNGNWIGFSEGASFSVAAPLANATSALPLPK
ncbi:hypothetical protein FOA52_014157 [Chlamydomonas sp. UWO 241]|nr:hypothetical protein FOA52_014157 [Chlamydomonas sp. UWO 241]